MRIVELIRLEENPYYGTFGVLRVDKEVFCVTLEPTDYANQMGRSSIPAQQYICTKYVSHKFGTTYQVLGVPERSGICFHPGNIVKDTEGCILLAEYFGKLQGNRAVLNSGNTFHRFITSMTAEKDFHLTIYEKY